MFISLKSLISPGSNTCQTSLLHPHPGWEGAQSRRVALSLVILHCLVTSGAKIPIRTSHRVGMSAWQTVCSQTPGQAPRSLGVLLNAFLFFSCPTVSARSSGSLLCSQFSGVGPSSLTWTSAPPHWFPCLPKTPEMLVFGMSLPPTFSDGSLTPGEDSSSIVLHSGSLSI